MLAWLASFGGVAAPALSADLGYGHSGSFGAADGQLDAPRQMAVQSSTGDVLIADSGNDRVDVFAPDAGSATYLTQFGMGVLSDPTGLAVDQSTGDVYVSGSGGAGIVRFTGDAATPPGLVPDPAFSGTDAAGLQGATALAVDPTNGDLLATDPADAKIVRYSSDGSLESSFSGSDSPGGPVVDPIAVAVDATGAIYVVDATDDPIESGGVSRAMRFAADGVYQHTYDVPTPGAIAIDPHTGYTLISGDVGAFVGSGPRVYVFRDDDAVTDFGIPGDAADPALTLRSITVDGGTSAHLYALTDSVFDCCGPVGVQVFVSGPQPGVAMDAPADITATGARIAGEVTPPGEQTNWHFETSTDGTEWTPAGADADAGSGSTAVPVGVTLSDLQPHTAYQVRLWAATASNVTAVSDARSFTTSAVAPSVGMTTTLGRVTASSAVVRGEVNPRNAPTTYYVEYGRDESYGSFAPTSRDADAGSGASAAGVSLEIDGLQATTAYHYRLVATNEAGTTAGDDHVLVTRADDRGSVALPDGRVYELVTPTYKEGFTPAPLSLRSDGRAFAFASQGNFAESGQGGTVNNYLAQRQVDGWTTEPTVPSVADYQSGPQGAFNDSSADLTEQLLTLRKPTQSSDQKDFYLRRADGSLVEIGPSIPAAAVVAPPGPTTTAGNSSLYLGASADLQHLIFRSFGGETHFPADASVSGDSLYEYVGTGNAAPRLVAVDNNGTLLDQCGFNTSQSLYHAMSRDGNRIFFDVVTPCSGQAFALAAYARVGGKVTVRLATSACTRTATDTGGVCNDPAASSFAGAAADGSDAYFTTGQQLVNADVDGGQDLYACELPAGTLAPQGIVNDCPSVRPVSVAGTSAGADVTGVVRISDDGSRVYFVAAGILPTAANAEGHMPVQGENNLYVYERTAEHPGGRVAFIGGLAAADDGLWSSQSQAEAGPASGRFLVFTTFARLDPSDTDDAQDVYRYDAQTQQLVRVSAAHGGYSGNGNADGVNASIPLNLGSASAAQFHTQTVFSDDGARVFFQTSEALESGDTNDQSDVYEYHDGQVDLISSGVDPFGSTLVAATPSGDDVLFATTDQLNRQDGDTVRDVYDARVGGGFASPPARVPCDADACQGDASAAPATPDLGTQRPSGVGTTAPAPRAPSFSVAAVTSAARRTLARTGNLRLTVRTSDAGRIVANATATIVKAKTTVGRASISLQRGGTYHLNVRLSKRGRAALASVGKLTVKLTVTYSRSAAARTITLKLARYKTTTAKRARARRGRAAPTPRGRSAAAAAGDDGALS